MLLTKSTGQPFVISIMSRGFAFPRIFQWWQNPKYVPQNLAIEIRETEKCMNASNHNFSLFCCSIAGLKNWTRFLQINQMNFPEIKFWDWVCCIVTKLSAENLRNLGILGTTCTLQIYTLQTYDVYPKQFNILSEIGHSGVFEGFFARVLRFLEFEFFRKWPISNAKW